MHAHNKTLNYGKMIVTSNWFTDSNNLKLDIEINVNIGAYLPLTELCTMPKTL